MEVPAAWVATGETGGWPALLGPDLEPSQARELQGTMFFAFPDLEGDRANIFEVPGVVDWLALLHERIPHLVYFLDPNPAMGALEGLLLTLVPRRERSGLIASGQVPLGDDVLDALATRLTTCAVYATAKGDDWEPIVSRFLDPLPDAAREYLDERVRHQLG